MPKTKAKPRTARVIRVDPDVYKMVEKTAKIERRTMQFVASEKIRAGYNAEGGKPSGESNVTLP